MSNLADTITFAHQLGMLEGRITALEKKVDIFEQRIEGQLGSIEAKLDQLTAALHLGRGGLLVGGAILVAISGLVGWLLERL